MAENQTEDQGQTNRAKTIEDKIRERNQEKEAVSTHQYYGLALDLERKLVKMNLILTVISSTLMLCIVCYGLAVWNIK
jgi:hypothetical protein